MFVINSKDTGMTWVASFWCLSSYLSRVFKHYFVVSIVDCKQVNAGWVFDTIPVGKFLFRVNNKDTRISFVDVVNFE